MFKLLIILFIIKLNVRNNIFRRCYADIARNAETRFNTSSYDIDRPLYIGKNKKVFGLMKD